METAGYSLTTCFVAVILLLITAESARIVDKPTFDEKRVIDFEGGYLSDTENEDIDIVLGNTTHSASRRRNYQTRDYRQDVQKMKKFIDQFDIPNYTEEEIEESLDTLDQTTDNIEDGNSRVRRSARSIPRRFKLQCLKYFCWRSCAHLRHQHATNVCWVCKAKVCHGGPGPWKS